MMGCRFAKVLRSGKLRFCKKSAAMVDGRLKAGYRRVCSKRIRG